jgi:hypothetical protein
LGGGTIVRLDVHGPDRPKPVARPRKKRSPAAQNESEWLAANRRKNRKKPIDKSSALEASYRAATKRRRKRAKKKGA